MKTKNYNLFVATIITLFAFTFSSFAQSPVLPIDFDDVADDAFTSQGGSTYSLESVLFSPDKVAKIVGGTDTWNSRIDLQLGTYIDMTTANKTFTFEFYTSEAVVMTGLFQIANEKDGGYPIEMQFTTDGSIGWQTITLDFTNATNGYPNAGQPVVYGQYAQLSVFTNFGDNGTSTYYVDDIAGAANGAVIPTDAAPATAAPTPSQAEENVISVYSDAYTTNIATNLNPGWGQSTIFSEVEIESNNTIKYKNLNYQGTEYTNPTDVSAMEYLHFDYWTDDATNLDFYLIASGENAYSVHTELGMQTGQWVSVNVPLSHYSNAGRDLTKAFQFKVVGNGTIYFDNMYFWKEPTVASGDVSLAYLKLDGDTIDGFSSTKSTYETLYPYGTTTIPTVTAAPTNSNAAITITQASTFPDTALVKVVSEDESDSTIYKVVFSNNLPGVAASDPSQAEANVISVYSDAFTTNIATNLNPGWGQSTVFSELQVASNNILKYANLNYQGTEYTNPTDVSGMDYLHFDYWTLDATSLEFYLIAGGENAYNVATELGIQTAQWVSVDVPLSYYSNAGRDLTNAIQFKVVGNGTIYFDNYYFYKDVPTKQNMQLENSMSIYPNPADNVLNFTKDVEQVEIYEISGRLAAKANISAQSYDISGLESGSYFIRMKDKEANVTTLRFIKK